MERVRVKYLGKLNSHKPQNPIKRMNKNFSINRYTLLDILIVDDIAASEDILGEIILYKTLRENIFVYFIMSDLYL